MAGDLPTLTKRQLDRLVDIGLGIDPHPRVRNASTEHLIAIDAVMVDYDDATGPVCKLKDLGVRILAGLPGAEFDRYRSIMEGNDA